MRGHEIRIKLLYMAIGLIEPESRMGSQVPAYSRPTPTSQCETNLKTQRNRCTIPRRVNLPIQFSDWSERRPEKRGLNLYMVNIQSPLGTMDFRFKC